MTRYTTQYLPGGITLLMQSIDHHRNGVCGEPFHVVLFMTHGMNEPGTVFVATVFDDPGAVTVLSVPKLDEGDIRFASNSWRGDVFEPGLRRAISGWEQERGADADAASASPRACRD